MAEDLWKLRQRKGMTIQQLAAKSGISAALLQEYEAGKRPIRSADLPRLARALFVEEWDIKDLSEPPPPRPAEAPPKSARAAEREQEHERPAPPPPRPAPAPAATATPPPAVTAAPAAEREQPVPPPRPAPPPLTKAAPPPERPARARKPPAPPGPARPTQIAHLLGLANKLGLEPAALEAELGKPADQLTFQEARHWLGEFLRRLRERRASAGPALAPVTTPETRHRAHLPESVDTFEMAYLTQHQQAGTRLMFKLFNGDAFVGRIIGFGPYNIAIRQDDGIEVNLQKLAIAYYRMVEPEQAGTRPEGSDEDERAKGEEGAE